MVVDGAGGKMSNWIECSERLPEKEGYYLVSGFYCQRQIAKCKWQNGRFESSYVTRWMPLPEEYK